MFEKLKTLECRLAELNELMSDPGVASNQKRYVELTKEHSDISPIIDKYFDYKKVVEDIEEAEVMAADESDAEMKEFAISEVESLSEQKVTLIEELKTLLIPKDPLDNKNAIMEIRAGTGGDEAALFAADIYKMYSRYAEKEKLTIEELSVSPSEVGGFKEIIVMVKGDNPYGRLRFEGGVHRVQRVPATETQGRIHTSAATVAVLPEADDVDVSIDPNELKIDVYRSSGPGGQSVNTTDSAVRITHITTGMVVTCQDEKSQHKNKAKALKVLKSRLLDKMMEEEQQKVAGERRLQVSSGDRSAKIRTYNFPEKRVTDHRINLTLYRLDQILQGDINELIDSLKMADQAERLSKNPQDA